MGSLQRSLYFHYNFLPFLLRYLIFCKKATRIYNEILAIDILKLKRLQKGIRELQIQYMVNNKTSSGSDFAGSTSELY